MRDELVRIASFCWVALAFAPSLASAGPAGEITEVAARQSACGYVRSRLSLGGDHFLRATRREDLEDDLFAAQVKVRGQIHKAAFFFEVTDTGYEIRSSEEAIFHSSVDGVGRWYVAVDALSGSLYGLDGFDEPQKDFNCFLRGNLICGDRWKTSPRHTGPRANTHLRQRNGCST
jgi:hypothetical protein